MGKDRDVKRESKGKPGKTIKEKRALKKAKLAVKASQAS